MASILPRAWAAIAILLLLNVPPLRTGSVEAEPRSAVVRAETEAYTDAGEVAWTAQPGDRFTILALDAEWIAAIPEGGASDRLIWLARDFRLELIEDPVGPTALPQATFGATAPAPTPRASAPARTWDKIPNVLIAAHPNDSRIPLVRDAVEFWNGQLAAVGSSFRLGPLTHTSNLVPDDYLVSIGSLIETEGGLPPVSQLPPFPPSVATMPGDLIVALSDAQFVSFSTPPGAGRKVVVGIRTQRTRPLSLPNVARNLIAHEIGHAIGIGHNSDATTLMCGRPASCRPDSFRSNEERYFPLTDQEAAQILRLYPPGWRPAP